MASEPKNYTFVQWLIIISNTQATQKKVEFFNNVYTVKGMQCHHSNHGHNYELKKQKQKSNKTIHVTQTLSLLYSLVK